MLVRIKLSSYDATTINISVTEDGKFEVYLICLSIDNDE